MRTSIRSLIVKAICSKQGIAKFSDINSFLKTHYSDYNPASTPQQITYYLRCLAEEGVIYKETRGVYRLRTFRYCIPFWDVCPKFSLLTALGRRDSRDIPEPLVALNLLKESFERKLRGQEEIVISPIKIITTATALGEWKDRTEDLSRIGEFKVVPEEYLISLEKIFQLLVKIVDELEKETIPILDCTPLTKIYTIAIFNIAIRRGLPVIYIYEAKKKLIFIQSLEQLKNMRLF